VQFGTPETILAQPADAFVEAFVGTDRALKRLALITAHAASEPLIDAAPSRAIAADASLRDALALMFSTGVDALAVVDAGGKTLGALTLARIRSHTRTFDPAKH
jgi:osmoprotectant transport system ATP-binding protein